MKETFSEYKETIENNLYNFTYLSDGDVISSKKLSFSKDYTNDSVSPSFIIDCIDEIYKKSIYSMIDKSIPFIIKEDLSLLDSSLLEKYIKGFGFTEHFMFYSKNIKILSPNRINSGPFPSYFYSRDKKRYFTPCIKDDVDEVFIFVVDKSIQNLTYSIQNMDYYVKKNKKGYSHTIKYDFYDCDFICYKIICKDIRKMRNEKINKILYGN